MVESLSSNPKSEAILIVDDTPDNLLMLFSYLEEKGYRILLAEDGRTTLQIARSKSPDLILLDVLMPDIDGFETCRRLKAEANTKEIPIISYLVRLFTPRTKQQKQQLKINSSPDLPLIETDPDILGRILTELLNNALP